MRVLVAGADGFIGRNVSNAFTEAGDEVFYGVRNTPEGTNDQHYRKIDLLNEETIRSPRFQQ
jgi:nucleoside-diphosphate-sugar epimerase